jgi:translation initiation factor IF-2
MKAMKALALGEERTKREYATILAFDVRVAKEAQDFAD